MSQQGDIKARLQEQLNQVEALIAKGQETTLDEMDSWYEWTLTVIRRGFSEASPKFEQFRDVKYGGWPPSHLGGQTAGYRQRLPRWARLLRTWIREIDEFEAPAPPTEKYIPPRSQFDAYVLLKDIVEGAAGVIIVVDPYTDEGTLHRLISVGATVSIQVLTVNPSKDLAHALAAFRQQWGGQVEARQAPKELHDRFLLVDDRVFLSGASFKDLGQRGSVVTEVTSEAVKEAIRKDIEAPWNRAQPIV